MVRVGSRAVSSLSLCAVSVVVVLVSGVAACSSTKGSTFDATGTGGANSSGASMSGAGGATGSSSGNGNAGGFDIGGTGGAKGGAGGGDTCAATTVGADPVPVNMYIIVDHSGSMADGFPTSKWDNLKTAFAQFFADPTAKDLSVAMRTWPEGKCDDPGDPNDMDCKAEVPVCQVPNVPLAKLSDAGHIQALNQSLIDAGSPSGGTPMSVALEGAEKWAAYYVLNHPGERAVVVLVTDGDPSACNSDPTYIAQQAAVGYQGKGILTFTVGVELQASGLANLQGISTAGHTGQPFQINSGGNQAAQFLTALLDIQKGSVGCFFKMPVPQKAGDKIDPTKVNVGYTPGGMGMSTTIGQVPGLGSCGAAGGWYYDNADMPTTITLCPASCTAIGAAPAGTKVDIELGCKTILM